jgi:cob(I)alamin adenosyltransferase
LARLGGRRIEILRLGTGFVTRQPPPEEAVEAARRGLALARERLAGGGFDLVILDEIFPACQAGLVTETEILDLIRCRPPGVHLVMTGRGAPAAAVERADLVTEMRCVKHPGEGGAEGQAGIEF